MNGKEMKRYLEKNGFVLYAINGSHHHFEKNNLKVTVPIHGKKELGKGIENTILKQAELK